MLQALQKAALLGLLLLYCLPGSAQLSGGAGNVLSGLGPGSGTIFPDNAGALTDALNAGMGDMPMAGGGESASPLDMRGVSQEPLPGLEMTEQADSQESPLTGIGDDNPGLDTLTPISAVEAEQFSTIQGLCSDVDADSVCDVEDYCPDTPAGAVVLPNGCHLLPDIPLELVGIFFDYSEARFRPESRLVLDRVVALLQQKAHVTVEVSGHTDSHGSHEFNQRLSERRAEAVYEYLVAHGVAPYRLSYRGYGDSQPVAPNRHSARRDNPDGRAMNRRVELRVTGSLAELDG